MAATRAVIDLVQKNYAGDVSEKKITEIVNGFLSTIAFLLEDGETVALTGFGSFIASHRGEKKARNPKTGEEIIVAPRVVVKFKPSKNLLDVINKRV